MRKITLESCLQFLRNCFGFFLFPLIVINFSAVSAQSRTAAGHDSLKHNVISNPIKKAHSLHKSSTAKPQYFYLRNERVKYAVFHTDTVRLDDTSKPLVTSVAEYVWDTINAGYIYVIKEQRLFCNEVKPEILQGDLNNMLKIIPENGFRHLKREGGEFRVNIEEALYDGGQDSVFIAVDVQGYIGGDADFEEHGVAGMRYSDLLHFNDSLYKSPDHYPMNRFRKGFSLGQ